MKKLLYLFLIFIGFSLLNSCDEEDKYDWTNYKPVFVGDINGPKEVSAHGILDFPYTYEVSYYRGGSSFAWTVTTYSGVGEAAISTEKVLEAEGKIANIVFPQRSSVDTAYITVTETTANGVSGDAYTVKVVLNEFCLYDMDAYVGSWTGTSGAHSDPVVTETTENLNELRVYGLADFVPTAWGENWVVGDGSCLIQFQCGDNINIPAQWIGDSDFPDVYGIFGSGTFDPATKNITLTYNVFYGWDGAEGTSCGGPWTTVLTLN